MSGDVQELLTYFPSSCSTNLFPHLNYPALIVRPYLCLRFDRTITRSMGRFSTSLTARCLMNPDTISMKLDTGRVSWDKCNHTDFRQRVLRAATVTRRKFAREAPQHARPHLIMWVWSPHYCTSSLDPRRRGEKINFGSRHDSLPRAPSIHP